ncbi:MAG: hypothetical protein H0X02_10580 [Nitrosomonas sp.]|nr:hypothetical protein [Nitrosomonas sp.]
MNFRIEIDDPVIYEAARIVAEHYKDYKFLERVRTIPHFNHTSHSGVTVSKVIDNAQVFVIIRPYKTWNPWSSAIGYASGKVIYVNTRKLNLPLMDRVENFLHEPLHLLGYSHKGNYVTPFNLETVPYKVAAVFRQYIEDLKDGKL